MEKENIKTVTIEDFKNSQHILDYIDDDFAIVNSLDRSLCHRRSHRRHRRSLSATKRYS